MFLHSETSFMRNLILFLIAAATVLLMDGLWLGVVMPDFYAAELGELARREGGAMAPRWGAAALVYLLIPLGILLFVPPVLGARSGLSASFGWGALFGLILYGVYDLTNLAVLDKWTLRVTIVDIAWGCVLCGTTALVIRVTSGWLPR
jgi:uncharacterized membrane protein